MKGHHENTPMWRRVMISGALGLGIVLSTAVGATASPPSDTFTVDSATVDATLTQQFEHYGDTSGTWSGADSAYSVPLPDGSTAWLYSDTFVGAVNPDHTRDEDTPFIHNSINVVRDGAIVTHTGGTPANPTSLVETAGGDGDGTSWYWFGDGTVEGSQLKVMLIEFTRTGTGAFDFTFTGNAVATFQLPDMTLTGVTKLDPTGNIQWGSAILEQGNDTYVYGTEDYSSVKYVHVAKVPTGHLSDPNAWRYWNGKNWTGNAKKSARITTGVSNEFSVQFYQGRYTLVGQDSTAALSTKIVAQRADSPTGPFDAPVTLYSTPETGGNVFTYNAKAHPELGDANTLVISYNVNSFATDDVYANVDNYRPRYIDVTTSTR